MINEPAKINFNIFQINDLYFYETEDSRMCSHKTKDKKVK